MQDQTEQNLLELLLLVTIECSIPFWFAEQMLCFSQWSIRRRLSIDGVGRARRRKNRMIVLIIIRCTFIAPLCCSSVCSDKRHSSFSLSSLSESAASDEGEDGGDRNIHRRSTFHRPSVSVVFSRIHFWCIKVSRLFYSEERPSWFMPSSLLHHYSSRTLCWGRIDGHNPIILWGPFGTEWNTAR